MTRTKRVSGRRDCAQGQPFALVVLRVLRSMSRASIPLSLYGRVADNQRAISFCFNLEFQAKIPK
jgi:hypothetical protein